MLNFCVCVCVFFYVKSNYFLYIFVVLTLCAADVAIINEYSPCMSLEASEGISV